MHAQVEAPYLFSSGRRSFATTLDFAPFRHVTCARVFVKGIMLLVEGGTIRMENAGARFQTFPQ